MSNRRVIASGDMSRDAPRLAVFISSALLKAPLEVFDIAEILVTTGYSLILSNPASETTVTGTPSSS